jgi:hypothetical protein
LFVSVDVTQMTPPHAGWGDIALWIAPAISVTAPIVASIAKGFIEGWAAEDAKELRAKLRSLMERGKSHTETRHWTPLCIQVGRVRFYFPEPLEDDEFVRRLLAAGMMMAELPDEAFDGNAGPSEYGHAWDKENQKWVGSILGITDYSPDFFRHLRDDA